MTRGTRANRGPEGLVYKEDHETIFSRLENTTDLELLDEVEY